MKWTGLMAALAFLLGLVVPAGALAAGGPVAPVQGRAIGVPGGPYRYTAFGAGGHTIVKRFGPASGPSRSQLRVSGRYGIPGVDFNGSMTGLSADGRTLVLAELPGNGPTRTTRLLVLDTPRLAVRARLAVPGFSTVDAISPDGRWLYLIQYAQDISRYQVRAYDLASHRLLAKPVVDPRERDEKMAGVAVNRVMSFDGRWAYTLYIRPSGVPFLHALDTAGRRAVCVDLPSLSNADLGNAHLHLTSGGGTLQIDDNGGVTQALIDTRTFAVTAGAGSVARPAIRQRPAQERRDVRRGSGGTPWELIVLVIAVLAALAASAIRQRRQKPSTSISVEPLGRSSSGAQPLE